MRGRASLRPALIAVWRRRQSILGRTAAFELAAHRIFSARNISALPELFLRQPGSSARLQARFALSEAAAKRLDCPELRVYARSIGGRRFRFRPKFCRASRCASSLVSSQTRSQLFVSCLPSEWGAAESVRSEACRQQFAAYASSSRASRRAEPRASVGLGGHPRD